MRTLTDGTVLLCVGGDADRVRETAAQLEAARASFATLTATSARDGLEQIDRTGVDCVLSSYDLPGMDGVEFLEAVREDHPTAPFVLVAAEGSEAVASEAIRAGVSDYVLRNDAGETRYEELADRIEDVVETARRRRTHREKSAQLDAVFEDLPVSIYFKDEQGRHLRVSRAHATGYGDADGPEGRGDVTIDGPEDFRGRTDLELFDDQNAVDSYEDDMQVIESGEPIENVEEHIHVEDGEDRWVTTTKIPWRGEDDRVRGVFGFTLDITDRKRHEQALERQNERLELALAATDTGVWEWHPESGELLWDEGSDQLFGYESGRFPGTYEAVADRIREEDRPRVEATAERALETGGEFAVDFRVQEPDGDQRWVHVRGVVEEDDDGGPTRMYGIQTDVTDRKEYEHELEETNRTLELLNRIVRHDIVNDMTLIMGYADRLEAEVGGETAREYLQQVSERGSHVVELTETIRDLMDAVLGENDETKPMDLGSVIDREVEPVRSMDQSVTVHVPEVEATVRADETLDTVVRNLLSNAVRHNDAEYPEVWVSVVDADDDVLLRVADNGPGVPPDQRAEIFGRGEKGLESTGTGVGLYLVDALVDSYGGDVRVEESEHGGAAFVVRLPRAETGR